MYIILRLGLSRGRQPNLTRFESLGRLRGVAGQEKALAAFSAADHRREAPPFRKTESPFRSIEAKDFVSLKLARTASRDAPMSQYQEALRLWPHA